MESVDDKHRFTRSDLEAILEGVVGKTLGEVDSAHVLDGKPSNRGMAGAVIEQSVLGYPADNAKRPDLIVDGVETELKTTGLRLVSEKKRKKAGVFDDSCEFEAKEPVTITAVSPATIVNEEFEDSDFWHKTAHMLFVYYLYVHAVRNIADYRDFPIKGFNFKDFIGDDKALLQKDWETVRDFIRELHRLNPGNPESLYPRISSELTKDVLPILDTAPKWPHHPRFRFRRCFVNTIVNEAFGKRYDKLPDRYDDFAAIDAKCRNLRIQYGGLTIRELLARFGIQTGNKGAKHDASRTVVRMFGGSAETMDDVEAFAKLGLIGRAVVLTDAGRMREDLKLFRLDLAELQDRNAAFEDSGFCQNFIDTQLLCAVFTKPSRESPSLGAVFRGFARIQFDGQVMRSLRQTWDDARNTIFNGQLRNVPRLKKNGEARRNKDGSVQEAPNFPKKGSRNSARLIFIRGDGNTAKDKVERIDNVSMYRQYLWVSNRYIDSKIHGVHGEGLL